jgi:hypothetical protein
MTKKEAIEEYLNSEFFNFDKEELIEISDSNFKYCGTNYCVYSENELGTIENEIIESYLNNIPDSITREFFKEIIDNVEKPIFEVEDLLPGFLNIVGDYYICED